MGTYTKQLPQLHGTPCITDGGLETELVFLRGWELPEFAAYHLLKSEGGIRELRQYCEEYLDLARRHGVGLVMETATWRCNADWGTKIGDSPERLDELNRQAVDLLEKLRAEFATTRTPLVISGCVGPRGDGYDPSHQMTADEAQQYHSAQIETFATSAADMIGALTLNYVAEAIGIARAAQAHGLPVCISFTVETDGRLPTGDTLRQAIEAVDEATDAGPAYYMINCAHPTHFSHLFEQGAEWASRIKGIRANASRLSHAELDESETLDDGDPAEFGLQYRELLARLPHLTVLGGCCGTDQRHVGQICEHLFA